MLRILFFKLAIQMQILDNYAEKCYLSYNRMVRKNYIKFNTIKCYLLILEQGMNRLQ